MTDLSVKKLVSWLETKDPNERYIYSSNRKCLCAQFLASQGLDVSVTPESYIVHATSAEGDQILPLPHVLDDIAFGGTYDVGRFTFGAALQRARRWLTVGSLCNVETDVLEDA
jgi:hypothetical protein